MPRSAPLSGCARIAAELFPKIVNQSAEDDDDADKKKPPVATITNFKVPTAVAFVNPAGKIIVSRGTAKKSFPSYPAPNSRSLMTAKNSSSRETTQRWALNAPSFSTISIPAAPKTWFTAPSARLSGLLTIPASHILQSQDQKWRVCVRSRRHSRKRHAPLHRKRRFSLRLDRCPHLVAADSQNMYWIGDDRPQQTLAV